MAADVILFDPSLPAALEPRITALRKLVLDTALRDPRLLPLQTELARLEALHWDIKSARGKAEVAAMPGLGGVSGVPHNIHDPFAVDEPRKSGLLLSDSASRDW